MPKLGLQLYTLRDLLKEDFIGTLRKVSKIGYEGVEFAGYGDMSIRELRRAVDDLGLTPVSNHVPLAHLETKLDIVIEEAKELGISYIVCPFIAEDRRKDANDYRKLAALFNQVGEKLAQEGLKFAYHNHAFEFVKFNEQYALDALYQWTDLQFVQAELDVYWIEYAGESAVEYIKKYANRTELLHVKDMTNDDERFFAEVGSGCLNIPGILETAQASNILWYLVEQDVSRRNPLESVEMSYRYLSGIEK
ncbi:sugar phosphate isomerase/epimerase [Fodinisporobacter ferrooxydans]|uniref:Sugar phosphate isomerase/epimerase n=1 Tax=Fodinisporobacter ferrooxydans TaxID=2901836 RepID=A0ABY4CE30_9BACL|nr:sugar phosphate isomerase/epimerase [Alicyclobacillaceae bacterium MYW30-H2]